MYSTSANKLFLHPYISSLSCSVRLRLLEFGGSSVGVGSHPENALVGWEAPGKLDDKSEDPRVDEDAMLGVYFTLPHTLQLDSTWTLPESRWTPFSPGGVYLEYNQMYILWIIKPESIQSPSRVHPESIWSLHRLWMDSLKECC